MASGQKAQSQGYATTNDGCEVNPVPFGCLMGLDRTCRSAATAEQVVTADNAPSPPVPVKEEKGCATPTFALNDWVRFTRKSPGRFWPAMLKSMHPSREQLQVLNAVIRLVVVDVMHALTRCKGSPQYLTHYPGVFAHSSFGGPHDDITRTVNALFPSPPLRMGGSGEWLSSCVDTGAIGRTIQTLGGLPFATSAKLSSATLA